MWYLYSFIKIFRPLRLSESAVMSSLSRSVQAMWNLFIQTDGQFGFLEARKFWTSLFKQPMKGFSLLDQARTLSFLPVPLSNVFFLQAWVVKIILIFGVVPIFFTWNFVLYAFLKKVFSLDSFSGLGMTVCIWILNIPLHRSRICFQNSKPTGYSGKAQLDFGSNLIWRFQQLINIIKNSSSRPRICLEFPFQNNERFMTF